MRHKVCFYLLLTGSTILALIEKDFYMLIVKSTNDAQVSSSNLNTTPLNQSVHATPKEKLMPMASFANVLSQAAEMTSQKSATTHQLQHKDVTTSSQNHTFLQQAQEALMYARLGVDKHKIDEIKAKMSELQALYEAGQLSEDDLQKQMEALQAELSLEFTKAQERRENAERTANNKTA